jgi:GGDEF domain-containing protein
MGAALPLQSGPTGGITVFFKVSQCKSGVNNDCMVTLEIFIWSCMLGGLITLACGALSEIVVHNSLASWRGLAYVLVMGSSCVLMSGLSLELIPSLKADTLVLLQSTFGPLSGALALRYLGLWLGVALVDRMVHITIIGGAALLVLVSGLLALVGGGWLPLPGINLLLVSASISGLGVVLAFQACVRASVLGDDLARWMVLACVFLAIMVLGLYACALWPDAIGLPGKALIAVGTVAHFLVGITLTARRNRQNRRLKRMSGDDTGFDRATGLPTGSVLLTKADDAFWRAERTRSECTVVALHLRNLYSMSEAAGHAIDQQILTAMAARIRRAVGFRCVVGLYHPRCFVVIIAGAPNPKEVDRLIFRLRSLLNKPLLLSDPRAGMHHFQPQFGVGISRLVPGTARPQEVLDETEQRALAHINGEMLPEMNAAATATASSPLR